MADQNDCSEVVGHWEATLAGLSTTILGVALGSLVDLKRTDEQILDLCKFCLKGIHSALADPNTTSELARLANKIKDGGAG